MTTQVLERPRNQPADPGKQSPTAVMALTDSDERLPSSPRPRRQPKTTTIEYPDSDGKPMAETAIHVRAIMYLYDVFEFLLKTIRADLSIYLAADMFLYYQEGNPRANKSPDLMLIKGVDGSYQRRSFKSNYQAMPHHKGTATQRFTKTPRNPLCCSVALCLCG
jgi:hypothetical protein